jgi:hypothetical protein
MEIPYRLDSLEAIAEAQKINLLDIGDGYRMMLAAARRVRIVIPPALARSRPMAEKSFETPPENVVFESEVQYRILPDQGEVRDFPVIEAAIPWVRDLAAHRNLRDFLKTLPVAAQKLCLVDAASQGAPRMLESGLATRRYLRREILSYAKAKRAVHLSHDEFRLLLVAHALFDTRNRDVYEAVSACSAGNADQRLYRRALAELLFARLPASLEELTAVNTRAVRRKVFSKIAKLPLRGLQRANLYAYFPPNMKDDALVPTLQKVARLAQRLNVDAGTKSAFHDYVSSIIGSMNQARRTYVELFGSRELDELRALHVPGSVMITATVKRMTRSAPIRRETLRFYPTKDYLDLFRGKISRDCIDATLGEQQLETPDFFNVRIFRDGAWIGNLYMLDLTESHRALLIDRIQIPRSTKAEYAHFFDDLSDVLASLFADVDYEEIVLPLTVSNHASIQKKYNDYRKKLTKTKMQHRLPYASRFESLEKSRGQYYVLRRKAGSDAG